MNLVRYFQALESLAHTSKGGFKRSGQRSRIAQDLSKSNKTLRNYVILEKVFEYILQTMSPARRSMKRTDKRDKGNGSRSSHLLRPRKMEIILVRACQGPELISIFIAPVI